MSKMIVFDMDGTIADLYSVDNWRRNLRESNPRPYIVAQPMYDTKELAEVVLALKELGYRIGVTTWLAKGSDRDFKQITRYAKRAWLEMIGFPYDEVHMVQYGTPKHTVTRGRADYQILVDDNEDVLTSWNLGSTINAKNCDILEELRKLLA